MPQTNTQPCFRVSEAHAVHSRSLSKSQSAKLPNSPLLLARKDPLLLARNKAGIPNVRNYVTTCRSHSHMAACACEVVVSMQSTTTMQV